MRQRHRTEIEKRAATIKELSARLDEYHNAKVERLETHQTATLAKQGLKEARKTIAERDATISDLNVRLAQACQRVPVKGLEMPDVALLREAVKKRGVALEEARKTIAEREAAIAELHAHISDLSTQPRAPARNTPPPGFHGPVSPPRTPSHPAPVWYPMPLPDTAGYEQRIAVLMRQVATLEGERDAYKSIVSTALAART